MNADDFRSSGRILTISNFVSFLRVLLTIPAIIFLSYHQNYEAAAVFILAYLSDLLDGFIARKTNTVSEWGKVIDPLADKLFVGIIIIALAVMEVIPIWFVAVILGRDLLIVMGGIYAEKKLGVVLPSNWMGKITVFTISLSLFLAVLGVSRDVLVFNWAISTALAVVSLFIYVKRMMQLLRGSGNRD
jgi:CDP-diacylglycerol--glycerol-3-phosphate 3-phosphatidyltransferase